MMVSRVPAYLAVVVTALTIASPVAAQRSGKPLLEQVARAMGGKEKILGIRTLVIEGTGREYNVGQNTAPDDALGHYEVTAYRRAFDFSGRRWQQESTREP